MNTCFKKLLTVVFASGLFAATTGMAGESYLDASSKMRGVYGNTTSRTWTGPVYGSTAPTVVMTQPAPNAIAKAPIESRSFSYEPAPGAKDAGKGESKKSDSVPSTAKRDTQTYRSFSYEPNSGPAMTRSRSSSSLPLYALPKTDPRKVGGGW